MDKRRSFASPLDRITEDGVLCLIISSLPLRDAVRTSVLSRRWRHIWTYLPKLKFSANNMFDAHTLSLVYLDHGTSPSSVDIDILLAEKADQFITSVDSVLRQHQGSAIIQKFKVKYYLHESHSHHIDAWVRFALESKSTELTINLQPFDDPYGNLRPEPYHFPCHLLESSSVEDLNIVFCSLKLTRGLDGLRHLKILRIGQVDVTEQDVNLLLSTCSALENLELRECMQLMAISSIHPLSRLQHLNVDQCIILKKIELNAINLTTMGKWGNKVNLIFRETSRLTEAHIAFHSPVDFDLNKLSKVFPSLSYLYLYLDGASKIVACLQDNANRFIHLKHVDWTISTRLQNKKGLLCLVSLLSAAPFIEKLNLCMGLSDSPGLSEFKQMKCRSPSLHTYLKTVEIDIFSGDKWHVKCAMFLLKTATELDSLMLKRKDTTLSGVQKDIFDTNMEFLKREVTINTNLMIL